MDPSESSGTSAVAAGGGTRREPRVTTSVQVREYLVTGKDELEILSSLMASAPVSGEDTFFGLTTSDLRFRYWRQPTADGCELVDLHVELGIMIDIPAWEPGADAPYELKRDWTRFVGALKRHEETHRDLAVKGAQDVLKVLQGIEAPTCDQAVAEAQRRSQRHQVETEANHRHFDEQTGHGETQGATWPVH